MQNVLKTKEGDIRSWIFATPLIAAIVLWILGVSIGEKYKIELLISVLAVAGMLFTILFQQQNSITQNRINNTQNFEVTFFNMLSILQKIIDDLCDTPASSMELTDFFERVGESRGRAYFEYQYSFKQVGNKSYGRDFKRTLSEKGIDCFNESKQGRQLDHYFRQINSILQYIDDCDWMTYKNKEKYASILHSTFSAYELVWIYYYGLSPNGRETIKPLLEKYSMLRGVPMNLLSLRKEDNFTEYSKKAFKD